MQGELGAMDMPDDLEPETRFRVETALEWLRLCQWQAAKAELDKIPSAKNRSHPTVLRAYAEVWEVSGKHAARIRCLKALIMLDPHEIEGHLQLNAALLAAGWFQEADQRMQEVLSKHPRHPALLFKQAVTCAHLGKLREAFGILTMLFSMNDGKYERVYLDMALTWPGLELLQSELLTWRLFAQPPYTTIDDSAAEGPSH
jgi:tetratricopeptide (TPR) repeat protein